jgi:hypothetical protein
MTNDSKKPNSETSLSAWPKAASRARERVASSGKFRAARTHAGIARAIVDKITGRV